MEVEKSFHRSATARTSLVTDSACSTWRPNSNRSWAAPGEIDVGTRAGAGALSSASQGSITEYGREDSTQTSLATWDVVGSTISSPGAAIRASPPDITW